MHNTQPEAKPVVEDCVFEANAAPYGGAMYCRENCDVIIVRSTFVSNEATVNVGGAIYTKDSSKLMIEDCRFLGNRASDDCGGVFVYDDSTAEIKDCVFCGNVSADKGGALYNRSGGNSTATNCTFAYNSAGSGGGMYVWGSASATMIGCIFQGNAANNGPQIQVDNGSSLVISYSNVDGGAGTIPFSADSSVTVGMGNFAAEAMFMDVNGADDTIGTLDDDLHLSEVSPCINRGDPGFFTDASDMDIDREPRVVASVVDVGADEFVYAGDTDFSGGIDTDDLAFIGDCWENVSCNSIECLQDADCVQADLNSDGVLDLHDFAVMAESWMKEIPTGG